MTTVMLLSASNVVADDLFFFFFLRALFTKDSKNRLVFNIFYYASLCYDAEINIL